MYFHLLNNHGKYTVDNMKFCMNYGNAPVHNSVHTVDRYAHIQCKLLIYKVVYILYDRLC